VVVGPHVVRLSYGLHPVRCNPTAIKLLTVRAATRTAATAVWVKAIVPLDPSSTGVYRSSDRLHSLECRKCRETHSEELPVIPK